LHRRTTRLGLVDPRAADELAAFLRTGQAPTGSRRRGRAVRDSTVALLLAQLVGQDELATDLVLDSIRAGGLLPDDLQDTAVAELRAGELAGRPLDIADPVETFKQRVHDASHDMLIATRDLVRVLSGFAGL